MTVEDFLRTLDAIRFDTSLDETNPELRGMARKIYPYIRKVYNMMNEADLVTESVNEEHGTKKHKSPKNTLNAMRKGNRDAEREIYGDGFKSMKKIHKTKADYNRKDNKVDINKLDSYNESKKSFQITESDIKQMVFETVKRLIKEDVDGNQIMKNLFGGEKLGDTFRKERNAMGYFIFFSEDYQPGMNINDINQKIEPVCTLTEEDINPEQNEVLINGKPVSVITENTNFYGEDNGNGFCQAGDLVFECNGEYAFYRPNLNIPTSFTDNNAMAGTKDEIMTFINDYLKQN